MRRGMSVTTELEAACVYAGSEWFTEYQTRRVDRVPQTRRADHLPQSEERLTTCLKSDEVTTACSVKGDGCNLKPYPAAEAVKFGFEPEHCTDNPAAAATGAEIEHRARGLHVPRLRTGGRPRRDRCWTPR